MAEPMVTTDSLRAELRTYWHLCRLIMAERRMLMAERFLSWAVKLAPKDHPDFVDLAYAMIDYHAATRERKGSVTND